MSKKPLISKCLAVGIILLFVGVTIAPAINFQVARASTDDDLRNSHLLVVPRQLFFVIIFLPRAK